MFFYAISEKYDHTPKPIPPWFGLVYLPVIIQNNLRYTPTVITETSATSTKYQIDKSI